MFYLSLSVLLSLCGLTGSALLNLFAVIFALILIHPGGRLPYSVVAILLVGIVFLFLSSRLSLSFAYPVISFFLIKKFKAISASDWYISLAIMCLIGFLLVSTNTESQILLDRNYFSIISICVSLCVPPRLGRMVLPNVLRIILLVITLLLLSRLYAIYLSFGLLFFALARYAPSLVSKLSRIRYAFNREFVLFMLSNLAYCAMVLLLFQPSHFLDKQLSINNQAGPARLVNLNDRSNFARLLSTTGYIESVINNPLGHLRPAKNLDAYLDSINYYSSSDEKIINTPHATLLAIFVNYGLPIGVIYIYFVFWLLGVIPRNKAFTLYAAYPAMFVLGGVLFGSTMPLYFLVVHHRSILASSCNKD